MLANLIVRRRWWIAAAWAAAAVALLPAAARVERSLEVAAHITGSESAAVDELLRVRFASPYARHALLVVAGIPSPGTSEGRRVLQRVVASTARAPGVTRTFSFLDGQDTLFLGRGDRGTFVVVGLDPGDARADALVPGLRLATALLEPELRRAWPEASLRWTGEIALNHDLRRTSAAQARAAEGRALPITLALLVAAFGTVAALCCRCSPASWPLPLRSALPSRWVRTGTSPCCSRMSSRCWASASGSTTRFSW